MGEGANKCLLTNESDKLADTRTTDNGSLVTYQWEENPVLEEGKNIWSKHKGFFYTAYIA